MFFKSKKWPYKTFCKTNNLPIFNKTFSIKKNTIKHKNNYRFSELLLNDKR